MWKGEQLARARRFGFEIPQTLLSNSPQKVLEFRKGSKDLVVKSLSSPLLGAEAVSSTEREFTAGLRTTVLTEAHYEELDAVRLFPCYFQELVPKAYELRVTVVGDRLFTARIDSQSDPRTVVDFRNFAAPVRYDAYSLPAPLAERCLNFVHSYGLEYGALDIIIRPDGTPVFLENNPAGQFLFIEELVPSLEITEAVATSLMRATR